ncbi:hypothetical protein AJ79_09873 [Helicocarpus griseus UAMH5409]|uniref:Uncharacterized protein n=1 Tax=Helicocarpus griseus UAMH5409 TaxID=1447875 RepID=A0A2B7WGY2_9EURO|nr:hypothetical protein AJ79_09873 [Helicocarpus griseus UAMH5409]
MSSGGNPSVPPGGGEPTGAPNPPGNPDTPSDQSPSGGQPNPTPTDSNPQPSQTGPPPTSTPGPSPPPPPPTTTSSTNPQPTPSNSPSEPQPTESTPQTSTDNKPTSAPTPDPTTTSQQGTTVTSYSTVDPTSNTNTQLPGATDSGAPSALPTNAPSEGSGGLSPAGTIAVAVVVPVVSVALIILLLLWWWRKRKATKLAEEERKQEIEEYRFNPNHDPTLPAVGLPGNYDDGSGIKDGNSGGYRGWGTTTSTSRKLSTNLSSGGGMNISDTGSNPGHPRAVSPVDDSIPYEDDNRPISGDFTGVDPAAVAAAGAAPAGYANGSSNQNQNIHRGPSNASSAYSAANRSDLSDDVPVSGVAPGTAQYYEDSAYYDGGAQQGGPLADGGYGNPQPVIRDVQARRNTRIESPSVFPQQGNAGIAQNF